MAERALRFASRGWRSPSARITSSMVTSVLVPVMVTPSRGVDSLSSGSPKRFAEAPVTMKNGATSEAGASPIEVEIETRITAHGLDRAESARGFLHDIVPFQKRGVGIEKKAPVRALAAEEDIGGGPRMHDRSSRQKSVPDLVGEKGERRRAGGSAEDSPVRIAGIPADVTHEDVGLELTCASPCLGEIVNVVTGAARVVRHSDGVGEGIVLVAIEAGPYDEGIVGIGKFAIEGPGDRDVVDISPALEALGDGARELRGSPPKSTRFTSPPLPPGATPAIPEPALTTAPYLM